MDFLQFLYQLFGSYGWAIIVFTVVIKMLLLPLTMQQIRSMKAMSALQPKMQELQKKYAKDKEKLAQAQMELYREAGVNPLGGCLPMLIQLPVLWGLYYALNNLAMTDPEFKKPFLWLADLSQPEGIPYILIIIMTISQFVYQKMSTPPSTDPQTAMNNRIMQFMPLMFAFIFIKFPSGLVLYWVVMNLVSIVQQYFIGGLGGLEESLSKFLPGPVRVTGKGEDQAGVAVLAAEGKDASLAGAGASDSTAEVKVKRTPAKGSRKRKS